MNKICNNCGNEFEAKRGTAKFCGDRCKKAHSRELAGQVSETDVTLKVSGTDKNVTLKDSDTRSWLIQQFKDEGKSMDEISNIMTAQDNYYCSQGHYFIPARMLPSREAVST